MAGCCWGCCKKLEESFGADRLDFEMDDTKWKTAFGAPSGLAMSLCCCGDRLFLVTKVGLFVGWLAVTLWSFFDWVATGPGIGYWFTKLTHWGAVLELAYFGFSAYSTYMALKSNMPDGMGAMTPWFVRATWFLSSIMPALTFMIVVLYWVLVYDGGNIQAISVFTHGVNFAFVLLDVMISRCPYYLAHLWAPLFISIVYVAFTYIYYQAGGGDGHGNPYIYSSIDWRNEEATGNLVGLIVLVGLPVIYALFFLVALSRKCCKRAPPKGFDEKAGSSEDPAVADPAVADSATAA